RAESWETGATSTSARPDPPGPAPAPPRRGGRGPRSRPASFSRGAALGDQPDGTLVGHVGPRPLHHHQDAVSEADQIEDVDEQPEEPADEALQLRHREIAARRGASDGGHVAEIRVVDRAERLPLDRSNDVVRG